jgi:D-tyrosyl-tRNA(Tyr) deacylase
MSMKAVVQRVSRAAVEVEGRQVASIGRGILTLLAVEPGDGPEQCEQLMSRIAKLRIFPDGSNGKMNHSVLDIAGEHLIVSQFTLLADLTKGNRPSFTRSGGADHARALFERAVQASQSLGVPTSSGVFQADMRVELVNDGPATFLIESEPGR